MDPVTLLSIYGSLSSIVSMSMQFFEDRKMTHDEIQEIIRKSDDAAKRISHDSSSIEAVAKISDDIREAIEKRISKRRTEILEDLEDETLTPRQQKAQITSGKADICRMLELIKEFNEGILPDQMQDMWKEMGCSAT